MSASVPTLLIALLGGLLPALFWLWFFLHEDPHPEPRIKLTETFQAGMLAVLLAIGIERVIQQLLGPGTNYQVLLGWAFAEEAVKFLLAWLVALRTKAMDEPVDALVYMLTVALGFAALENTLFLVSPISEALYLNSALSGGLRFLGATLVHVVSSGILGASLALSFYRRKRIQHRFIAFGLVLATLLHWGFNLLIMNVAQDNLFSIFLLVWVGIIGLMLVFERAKRLKKLH